MLGTSGHGSPMLVKLLARHKSVRWSRTMWVGLISLVLVVFVSQWLLDCRLQGLLVRELGEVRWRPSQANSVQGQGKVSVVICVACNSWSYGEGVCIYCDRGRLLDIQTRVFSFTSISICRLQNISMYSVYFELLNLSFSNTVSVFRTPLF